VRFQDRVCRFELGSWACCLASIVVTAVLMLGVAACGRRSPTSPGQGTDLTGAWSGTSSYPNAPFTMTLRQSGTVVRGDYRDRGSDVGTVYGTASGTIVQLDVNFGDTGLRLTGALQSRDRITGEILVPSLGGQRFPFEMTR